MCTAASSVKPRAHRAAAVGVHAKACQDEQLQGLQEQAATQRSLSRAGRPHFCLQQGQTPLLPAASRQAGAPGTLGSAAPLPLAPTPTQPHLQRHVGAQRQAPSQPREQEEVEMGGCRAWK